MSRKDSIPIPSLRLQSIINNSNNASNISGNLSSVGNDLSLPWPHKSEVPMLPRKQSGLGTNGLISTAVNLSKLGTSVNSSSFGSSNQPNVELLPLPSLPRKFSFNMSRYGITDELINSNLPSPTGAASGHNINSDNLLASSQTNMKQQTDKGWALYLPYHVRECYGTKTTLPLPRISNSSQQSSLVYQASNNHTNGIVLNINQFAEKESPSNTITSLPPPPTTRSRAVSLTGGNNVAEANILTEFPILFETWSVVAMVDISGYSALASQLFKSISHAGEVLQRIVNEIFQPILNIIMDNGGDVVKFAGDAILVCWTMPSNSSNSQLGQPFISPVSSNSVDTQQMSTQFQELVSLSPYSPQNIFGSLISKTNSSFANTATVPPSFSEDEQCNITNEHKLLLTAYAISACHKIAKQMRGYTKIIPELEKTVKLDVHISLAGGVTHHVHVGNKGTRREYFLSGPATLQATGTIDKAKRGEVVLPLRNFRDEALEPLKQWISVETNAREGFVTIKSVKEELQSFLNSKNHLMYQSNVELSSKAQKSVQEYLSDYALYRLFGKKSVRGLAKGSSQTEVVSKTGTDVKTDGEIVASTESLNADDTENSLDVPLPTDVKSDINELRRIVVMFIKLKPVGDIRTKTDYLCFYQMCMSMVVSKLAMCEGQLRQFAVDDKADNGCTALCVWGLPPWSHEVEERFALKMALELRSASASMNISMVIGIAAGPAFTGYVGNASRRDHTILGDCVNLAARYLGLATHEHCILCDDSVCNQEIRDRFRLKSLGKKKIKGKEHEIEVFSLVDRLSPQKTVNGTAVTMNKSELERMLIRRPIAETLLNLYHKWHTGEKVRIVLEGESGQGKSFLSNYLVAHAQSENVIAWTAQASEYDQTLPLHVFRALVSNLLNMTLNADIQKKLQSFTNTLNLLAGGLEVDPANKDYRFRGRSGARPWSIYETVSQNTMSTIAKTEGNSKQRELNYTKYVERMQSIQNNDNSSTQVSQQKSNTDVKPSDENGALNPPLSNDNEKHLPDAGSSTEDRTHANEIQLPDLANSSTLSTVVKAARLAPKVMLETLKEFAESPDCWLIYKALVMLDEDVRLIPLFRKVMPNFVVSDNSYTNMLTDEERTTLLLDCLQRSIDKISRIVPCCLILDDYQWSDVISWRFVSQIAQKCPRLLILLVTRPVVEFRDPTCVNIYEKEIVCTSNYMPLEALSEKAVFSYLSAEARSFEFPAKELVRVASRIYHQSGGNLSIVARLVETFIRTAPKLTSRDSVADQFENLLGNVSDNSSSAIMRSIVLSQFDKLDNDFQEILKISSCMISGAQFSLQEVVNIAVASKLFSINLDAEAVHQKIQGWDLFRFLTPVEGLNLSNTSSPVKGGASVGTSSFGFNNSTFFAGRSINMSPTGNDSLLENGFRKRNFSTITFNNFQAGTKSSVIGKIDIKYQFRHAAIQAAIYNSLLTEKRQALHVKIAKYYESRLVFDDAQTNHVIPIIFYHYSRTNCRDERFLFMELTAAHLINTCNYIEAKAVLQELILMAIQEPSLVNTLVIKEDSAAVSIKKFSSFYCIGNAHLVVPSLLVPSDVRFLAKLRIVHWHYFLSDTLHILNETENCEKTLLKALTLLGFSVNPRAMLFKLWISKYLTTNYIKNNITPSSKFKKIPTAYQDAYYYRSAALFCLLFSTYKNRKGLQARTNYCALMSYNMSLHLREGIFEPFKLLVRLSVAPTFLSLSMRTAIDRNNEAIESHAESYFVSPNLEKQVARGIWAPALYYAHWQVSNKELSNALKTMKICTSTLTEMKYSFPLCLTGEFYCRFLWLTGNYDQCMKIGRLVLDFGLQDDSNDFMFSIIPCPLLPIVISSTELDCMSMLPLKVSRLLQKLMDQSTNDRTVLGCLILVFNMEVQGGDMLQASLRIQRILSYCKRSAGDAIFSAIILIIMSRAAHRFVIGCLESNAKFFNRQVLQDLMQMLKELSKNTNLAPFHNVFDKLVNEGFSYLWKEIDKLLPKIITSEKDTSKEIGNKSSYEQQSIESSRRNSAVNFQLPVSANPSTRASLNFPEQSVNDAVVSSSTSVKSSDGFSCSQSLSVHQIPCSSAVKVFESLLNVPEVKDFQTLRVWILELIGRHHPDAWKRQESLMQSYELANHISARSQAKYLVRSFPTFLKN